MEKNKAYLETAIARLPEYQPPAVLWEDIAEQLDFDDNLQAPLREMPTYNPPPALWEALAGQMEQTPELQPRRSLSKWRTVALFLALVFILGFWFLKPPATTSGEKQAVPQETPKPVTPEEPIAQMTPVREQQAPNAPKRRNKTSIPMASPQHQHRTEVVDDVLIMACRQTNNPDDDLVANLCRDALPVCEEPAFKKLKAEFDYLTQAHTELKNALGDFADDPELITQLVEIERSRDQILQQMITLM